MISCCIPAHQSSSEKGSAVKGNNLLPNERSLLTSTSIKQTIKYYGGIFLPRGSQIAIAIIFLIFQKIKKNPENIIAITSII